MTRSQGSALIAALAVVGWVLAMTSVLIGTVRDTLQITRDPAQFWEAMRAATRAQVWAQAALRQQPMPDTWGPVVLDHYTVEGHLIALDGHWNVHRAWEPALRDSAFWQGVHQRIGRAWPGACLTSTTPAVSQLIALSQWPCFAQQTPAAQQAMRSQLAALPPHANWHINAAPAALIEAVLDTPAGALTRWLRTQQAHSLEDWDRYIQHFDATVQDRWRELRQAERVAAQSHYYQLTTSVQRASRQWVVYTLFYQAKPLDSAEILWHSVTVSAI